MKIKDGEMKKLSIILPLALILCFVVGCQDKEALTELEAMKAQAEVEEQNKEIVKLYLKVLDQGNIEIIKEVFAPNFLGYFPSNSATPISREELLDMAKGAYESLPDLKHDIQELIAKGDKVVVMMIFRGTHLGDFTGIPASGKKIEFGAILLYRLENGKIVELRREVDLLGAYQQLGMELKPKESAK